MMEHNIRKVVFIGYQPLSEKAAEDFFIFNFQGQKIIVEYWDLSLLFFPKIPFEESLVKIPQKKIYKKSQLKTSINKQNLSETLFFINFSFDWRVVNVYLLLSVKNLKKAIIVRGMMPLPRLEKKILQKLTSLNFQSIKRYFLSSTALVLKKIKIIKPFDFVFYAGEESFKIIGLGYSIDKRNAQLVSINSSDYDKFINKAQCKSPTNGDYIVFLDEYLPFHPDFDMFNIPTIESKSYFSKLNNFFENIEREYGVEVIIAAHPKASKYKTNNFFQGRKTFFGNTIDLVENSKLVIAHMSTSIGYSVIYNKRCILLFSNEIKVKMKYQFETIKSFSIELDLKMINIDEFNIKNIFPIVINKERYNNYKYKYLTNKTHDNIDSFQIVKNYLNV